MVIKEMGSDNAAAQVQQPQRILTPKELDNLKKKLEELLNWTFSYKDALDEKVLEYRKQFMEHPEVIENVDNCKEKLDKFEVVVEQTFKFMDDLVLVMKNMLDIIKQQEKINQQEAMEAKIYQQEAMEAKIYQQEAMEAKIYQQEVMEAKIYQQEVILNQQEAKISQQEVIVNQQEAKINQQEVKINQQEAKINQQEAKINQQEAIVNQQEAKINQQEAIVNQKEAKINQQVVMVNQQKVKIIQQEAIINQQEAKIIQLEADVEDLKNSLTRVNIYRTYRDWVGKFRSMLVEKVNEKLNKKFNDWSALDKKIEKEKSTKNTRKKVMTKHLECVLQEFGMTIKDFDLLSDLKATSNSTFHNNDQSVKDAKNYLNKIVLPEDMILLKDPLQKALNAIEMYVNDVVDDDDDDDNDDDYYL